jgi:hypothetical protein
VTIQEACAAIPREAIHPVAAERTATGTRAPREYLQSARDYFFSAGFSPSAGFFATGFGGGGGLGAQYSPPDFTHSFDT